MMGKGIAASTSSSLVAPEYSGLADPLLLLLLSCLQGWGTVRFTTTEAANAAIEQFHGSSLEGRTLTVFLDKKA
jgi:hypothetical protein